MLPAKRQNGPHAPLEQGVVPFRGICLTVPVTKGQRALADAFEDDGVELPAFHQVHRWIQSVRREPRSRADAVDVFGSHGANLSHWKQPAVCPTHYAELPDQLVIEIVIDVRGRS